jgi:hypothetical protein
MATSVAILARTSYGMYAWWPGPPIGAIGHRHVAFACIGLPCRSADRSLVVEDQSAEGVRDWTGPQPLVGPC